MKTNTMTPPLRHLEMSVSSCLFGFRKLVEKSQGPRPVHATDVGNGFAMVLYSDDSVRTRSVRDPKVRRLLRV